MGSAPKLSPTPGVAAYGLEACKVADAIIFVSRTAVRPMLRQELKSVGVLAVHTAESLESCRDLLANFPQALLVIDYEHGPRIVNQILAAAQSHFKVDTRPIFLIAGQVSLDIVAIGAEYNASRVHTGEISRDSIQDHIEAIVADESEPHGLRDGLCRVAAARMAGKAPAATALLFELYQRFPDNRRVTCDLAESLIQEDRWQEAHAVLEQLSVVDKTNLRAQHLLSRCLMKLDRYEEAAEVLRAAKLINPYNVDRLVTLAQALLQLDRVREALANFREALALDGDNLPAKRGVAQCRLMTGEVNEALVLLREIGTTRELAAVFNNAAILSIRAGRFDAGVNLYRAAIGAIGARERMLARLLYNLGIAFHKNDHPDDALECFERAHGIDPAFEKSRHNAIVLAAKLGRAPQLATLSPKAAHQLVVEEFSSLDDDNLGAK